MVRINNKFLIMICLLSIIFAAYFVYARKRSVANLIPLSTQECNSEINWHGLSPGKSNQENVIEILGEPYIKGRNVLDNHKILYFEYKINAGKISNYAMDRIYFRSDGLIDWMEIIEADRNGEFSSLSDITNQLGPVADTAYSNNNFNPENSFPDVLAGPDKIYVWSECGLALDVLPSTYSPLIQDNKDECSSLVGSMSLERCNLTFRYPSPYNFGEEFNPDVNSIVLMKFYFQPTSYEAFVQNYMYKIPYGIWDSFLREYK